MPLVLGMSGFSYLYMDKSCNGWLSRRARLNRRLHSAPLCQKQNVQYNNNNNVLPAFELEVLSW